MPKRFRTRIVEIEALRWENYNLLEMMIWTEDNFRLSTEKKTNHDGLVLTGEVFDKLHNAWIGVAPGQWIVRGVKGEYYPCDDETFHWKYEEIITPKVPVSDTCPYEGRHQGNAVFQEGDTCRHCGWTL